MDNHSNLTSVKNSLGNVTKYEYDKAGRCISIELAMGQKAETVYDKAGRAVKTTDFNDNVTEYDYDKLGQLTELGIKYSKTYYEYGENGTETITEFYKYMTETEIRQS